MKHIFTFFIILLSIYNYSQVAVKGYYRKDGTYVRPHVRTPPNSTVTDNYSYKGNYNPNLEYNPPARSSSSTYNYYDNSSSSNYDTEWVNGYYRANGTYVNGYYRKRKKAKTSSSNNSIYDYYDRPNSNTSTYSTKKYVNTANVNFRRTPEVTDNIIAELSFTDEVISIESVGYWDKVKVRLYNPNTYSYSTIDGFINSRYLTTTGNSGNSEITYNNAIENNKSKNFKVNVDKTYFCTTPNIKDMRKAFLVYGDRIYGIAESKYFVYTEFTNSYGQKSVGWILKDDLIRE